MCLRSVSPSPRGAGIPLAVRFISVSLSVDNVTAFTMVDVVVAIENNAKLTSESEVSYRWQYAVTAIGNYYTYYILSLDVIYITIIYCYIFISSPIADVLLRHGARMDIAKCSETVARSRQSGHHNDRGELVGGLTDGSGQWNWRFSCRVSNGQVSCASHFVKRLLSLLSDRSLCLVFSHVGAWLLLNSINCRLLTFPSHFSKS